jgi:hypothetical protein
VKSLIQKRLMYEHLTRTKPNQNETNLFLVFYPYFLNLFSSVFSQSGERWRNDRRKTREKQGKDRQKTEKEKEGKIVERPRNDRKKLSKVNSLFEDVSTKRASVWKSFSRYVFICYI